MFEIDDEVFFVANGVRVVPVRVMKVEDNLVTVRVDQKKAIRLPAKRLYETAAEAEKHIRKIETIETGYADPHEWQRLNGCG